MKSLHSWNPLKFWIVIPVKDSVCSGFYLWNILKFVKHFWFFLHRSKATLCYCKFVIYVTGNFKCLDLEVKEDEEYCQFVTLCGKFHLLPLVSTAVFLNIFVCLLCRWEHSSTCVLVLVIANFSCFLLPSGMTLHGTLMIPIQIESLRSFHANNISSRTCVIINDFMIKMF